jgi:hypothetical protein
MQRSGVRVKPCALRPGISSTAEKLILHAISYNPNDRPATANGFGDALSHALLNSHSTQTIQMEAIHTKRVRLGWIAGALMALVAAGAAWVYRGRLFPSQSDIARQTAAAPAAIPAAVPKSDPAVGDAAVELAFWNSIGASSDPRLYREYLAKYPNGRFASLAKLKLEEPPSKAVDAHRPPQSPVPVQPSPSPAATAPAPKEAVALAPKENVPPTRPALKADEYSGPLRGELRWAGSLPPGANLTIQGGKAVSGDLTGDLPRVPSTVEALTNGVLVVDQPSAANQWDRVVVKNGSSTPVNSIQIRWRVAR